MVNIMLLCFESNFKQIYFGSNINFKTVTLEFFTCWSKTWFEWLSSCVTWLIEMHSLLVLISNSYKHLCFSSFMSSAFLFFRLLFFSWHLPVISSTGSYFLPFPSMLFSIHLFVVKSTASLPSDFLRFLSLSRSLFSQHSDKELRF